MPHRRWWSCGRINAGRLHRFDEERPWILCAIKQDTSMPVDVSIEVFAEVEQVREDQPERPLAEER